MNRIHWCFVFSLLLLCNDLPAQNLDRYLETALKNSPLLRDISNEQLSNRYDSLLVRATFRPQITQNTRMIYAPVARNWGYNEAITDGGNYAAQVAYQQTVFGSKLRNTALRQTSLVLEMLKADQKIGESDILQEVTAQYLSALANLRQIQFSNSMQLLLEKERKDLSPLVDKGIYQHTDLFNLDMSISDIQLTAKQALIDYKNNLAILNFLCGICDTTTIELSKPDLPIRTNFDLTSSPIMLKMKIDSLKSINSRDLVDASYRPRISLFADAGINAIDLGSIQKNIGTSFGVNFTLPIYDGEQKKLQKAKIDVEENTQKYFRETYVIQFRQRVLQTIEQLRLNTELAQGITKQCEQQEKLLDIYHIEMNKGLVRFLDVLDAISKYAQLKNNLTLAENTRLQLINQLYYIK